jgi:hypothetical protein
MLPVRITDEEDLPHVVGKLHELVGPADDVAKFPHYR